MARADGVINELVRASSMATEELRKATDQLQAIEREAGADLSDLRGLSDNNGASSTSRAQLEAVKTELRQIENLHTNLTTDLALLRETQTAPERILSAPASVLSAHPGLKKTARRPGRSPTQYLPTARPLFRQSSASLRGDIGGKGDQRRTAIGTGTGHDRNQPRSGKQPTTRRCPQAPTTTTRRAVDAPGTNSRRPRKLQSRSAIAHQDPSRCRTTIG